MSGAGGDLCATTGQARVARRRKQLGSEPEWSSPCATLYKARCACSVMHTDRGPPALIIYGELIVPLHI